MSKLFINDLRDAYFNTIYNFGMFFWFGNECYSEFNNPLGLFISV